MSHKDWHWHLIRRNINIEHTQIPSITREDVLELFRAENKLGNNQVIGLSSHKCVFVLREYTQYVCEVYVFSESKEPWGLVTASKKFLEWVWKNTNYRKLEFRTHQRNTRALAKRLGFEQEGYRVGSYITQMGDALDEIEFGLTRPQED